MTRPTLGSVQVTDSHTRTVDVDLTNAEPMSIPVSDYRRMEGRFQPSKLRLIWRGTPAQLVTVDLIGLELNKNGQVNARMLTHRHSYLGREMTREAGGDGQGRRSFFTYRLSDDTPDWVRELIDQHAPDWPALPTPTTAEEN